MIYLPPTRVAHHANCERISIALKEYVRELYEIARFAIDEWVPAPFDDAAYHEWMGRS